MSTTPTDFDSLSKRAAGRYHYNKIRQFQALLRLTQVIRILYDTGFHYGYQNHIAEALGVHRSTICRDIARLSRVYWGGQKADEEHRATVRIEAAESRRRQGGDGTG